MSRFYETALVLFLLTILVCGLAWVASAIIDNDKSSKKALFGMYNSSNLLDILIATGCCECWSCFVS